MSCNAICLPEYQCGSIKRISPDGAVYAPFVEMTLGSKITVGNKSFNASPHSAVIKSFDYGGSSGTGCTVEIIDEQGTSFTRYYDELNKDICEAPEDYKMKIDFGWIVRSCNGTVTRKGVQGGPVYFLPSSVDSSYEGGKIKYTIKGEDMMSLVGENRIEAPVGSESNKVQLGEAMRKVVMRNCPKIARIMRKRLSKKSDSEWRFKNSDGGEEGPYSVWPGDQQNAMSTIRKWCSSVTTDRKKGFTPVWNPASPEPELWLVEDSRSYCDEAADGSDCVGTYIVNGGDCSPVLSFSPSAKWIFTANLGSGGNSGGGASQRQQKQRVIRSRFCKTPEQATGTTSQFPTPQNDINWRPPDQIASKLQESLAMQELAAQYGELSAPIEAELKIVGDPFFVHPILWQGAKTLSIVVINPFYIYGGSYCEWLAGPMCNPIYSDKNYMIMGVNHQIKEGSYTTTLKVVCNNVAKTEG